MAHHLRRDRVCSSASSCPATRCCSPPGILAGQGKLDIAMVVVGCFVAAVVGDQVGYTIGKKARAARCSASRLAALQAGVRRAHQGVLREARAEDDRDRPLRAHRAHVRADARRRRRDAAQHVLQATTSSARSSGRSASRCSATRSATRSARTSTRTCCRSSPSSSWSRLIPPFLEWRKARQVKQAGAPATEAVAEAEELEEILNPDD